MDYIIEKTIDNSMSDKTIKFYLTEVLKLSSRQIVKLKEQNNITIDDMHQTVRYVLKNNDKLKLIIKEQADSTIIPTAGRLNIVYEDNDILIVDKPANLSVHPSKGNYTLTLGNYIAYYFLQKNIDVTLHIITRLDKNTSGLVIVALNNLAAQRLGESLINNEIYKEYLAIITGDLLCKKGVIDLAIDRKSENSQQREVSNLGKKSVTCYEILEKYDTFTLVKLVLKTGRTHQIRVHLSHQGCPIVGDLLYGGISGGISRHALHMSNLAFNHPITNMAMTFTSNLPLELYNLLK